MTDNVVYDDGDRLSSAKRMPVRGADDGPGWAVEWKHTQSADMSAAAVAVTDHPDSGKKRVITDIVLSAAADMTVTLRDELAGTTWGIFYLAALSPVQITPRSPVKLSQVNSRLTAQASTSGNIAIEVASYSEA